MPRGVGPPNGPCSRSVCDSSVELTQGDLMLCRNCLYIHFPHLNNDDTRKIPTARDWEIIGEKPRLKSSNTRPGEEAHLYDILCAINELDAGSKMPCVVIDAYSLSQIPRSHPEELNNISLLDRLNRLEQRMSGLIYKK